MAHSVKGFLCNLEDQDADPQYPYVAACARIPSAREAG